MSVILQVCRRRCRSQQDLDSCFLIGLTNGRWSLRSQIGNGSIEYDYSMRGRQLDVVTTEKDLGVLISSNLNVTNRMLGLLNWTCSEVQES